FVEVLMTETVFELKFETYAREPSGETATPTGLSPTITVAVTIFVAMSTTETLLLLTLKSPEFMTYAKGWAYPSVAPQARINTAIVTPRRWICLQKRCRMFRPNNFTEPNLLRNATLLPSPKAV